MKKILALLVLLTTCAIYSQTKFEKGYFITTKGNKVECLIKNEDWIGIPSFIEYKTNDDGKINVIQKQSINKLHIKDKILLERHTVLIERYSKNLDELTTSRLIKANEENLLLKVIVDGKVRLLRYNDKAVEYFFYQLNEKVLPLEFKLYKTSKGTVGKNLNYQKTLRENLNCPNSNLDSNFKYKEKYLVRYFEKYNSCFSTDSYIYSKKEKSKLNLRGKLSLGNSKLEGNESQFSIKIGVEFEYILPFNNNKWSIFVEPTFQTFSQKDRIKVSLTSSVVTNIPGKASYSSIEIPIGLRHYFFIDSNNKIFSNAGFNLDWAFDDFLLKEPNQLIEINTTVNYFLGLGYEFNKKYSAELRYNTARDLSRFSNGTNNFTNFSLKFGYNFLD